jgi:hypothetical protein
MPAEVKTTEPKGRVLKVLYLAPGPVPYAEREQFITISVFAKSPAALARMVAVAATALEDYLSEADLATS